MYSSIDFDFPSFDGSTVVDSLGKESQTHLTLSTGVTWEMNCNSGCQSRGNSSTPLCEGENTIILLSLIMCILCDIVSMQMYYLKDSPNQTTPH